MLESCGVWLLGVHAVGSLGAGWFPWADVHGCLLVVVGVGFRLLVENYIVDASILTAAMCDAVWCCVLWWLVVSLKFKFFLDSLLNVFSDQIAKGKRWMPWHLEPKKDVVICDKPRGADKRALIRGFPNGGTRLDLI